MRRPDDLSFALEDRPPTRVLVSAAAQQTAIICVFVYPAILLARVVDATPAQSAAIISLTFVVCGLSTLLHACPRFGIGSGFLTPSSAAGGAFLAPSLLAAQTGGLPLVAGMTAVAGVATLIFARCLNRLRTLFPAEVAGTVALIIGVAISLTGVRALLLTSDGAPPSAGSFLAATVTVAVAGGLSVWGKGMLLWTSVLIAMVVGSLCALALGEADPRAALDISSVPVFGLPEIGHIGWAFDPALLPAFLVAALAGAVRSVGLITTLQKINDADWVRPEPRSIAGGVAGDGATILLAGLLAAPAANMSTTNITAQAATGITSRVVAFGTGGACLALACFPRAGALLAQVPIPVLAAILLQAGGQMVVNGMQLATSRMLDARRSLAIGLAVVTALSLEAVPQVVGWVPGAVRPLISSIALGTLVAIGLNALLRIGIRKEVTMTVRAGEVPHGELADFATRAGRAWAAHPDVIARTADLAALSVDAIVGHRLAEGDVTVTLAFDEFRIDLGIAYRGRPLELVQVPPSAEDLLNEDAAAMKLAGYMVCRRATRASVRLRDGVTRLAIVIDH